MGVWSVHLFLVDSHEAIVQPEARQAVMVFAVITTTADCTALCNLILVMREHLHETIRWNILWQPTADNSAGGTITLSCAASRRSISDIQCDISAHIPGLARLHECL